MAYTGMTNPSQYQQAIRTGGVAVHYSLNAMLGATTLATGLRPVGGSISDTSKPGVRRTLSAQLAPSPGMYDLLSKPGTRLNAYAHVRLTSRSTVTIPMGVFEVDRETIADGKGGVSLTAPDKWRRIQRARLVRPYTTIPGRTVVSGLTVVGQIVSLMRDALGNTEPVQVLTTNMTRTGPLTWERDRDKAILELAKSIGCWVYFDRDGVFTIADLPRQWRSADWTIDASENGVLLSLDRSKSLEGTYNVVMVSSSNYEGEKFPPVVVWDNDPSSPTYAGTNPATAPSSAGPFGVVPYFWETPILETTAAAQRAALTILARTRGLSSQVSLSQVPNPALDALDALDVLPPRERYDMPRVVERHVADTITHPFGVSTAQNIEARSTSSEEIEAGL